jgi:hypothetical protein
LTPCNMCYTIYYSQEPNGNDTDMKRLDITYQLNYVDKDSINSLFIVKNDTFDPTEANTYTFNCSEPINKPFFSKLVNSLNRCITNKYKDRIPK